MDAIALAAPSVLATGLGATWSATAGLAAPALSEDGARAAVEFAALAWGPLRTGIAQCSRFSWNMQETLLRCVAASLQVGRAC